MAFLQDRDREIVRGRLDALPASVRLVHFTQALDCETCPEARALLEELAGLSEKLQLEVLDLQIEPDRAAEHGIDQVPGTVIFGPAAVPLRYFGTPSGYEFATLLQAIELAAGGDSGLEPATRQKLAAVAEPMQLQVFVTPT